MAFYVEGEMLIKMPELITTNAGLLFGRQRKLSSTIYFSTFLVTTQLCVMGIYFRFLHFQELHFQKCHF